MIYEYKKLSVYAYNVPLDSREFCTFPSYSEQFYLLNDSHNLTINNPQTRSLRSELIQPYMNDINNTESVYISRIYDLDISVAKLRLNDMSYSSLCSMFMSTASVLASL